MTERRVCVTGDDAGYTIIELLMSILILGLIVGPLCGAVFVVMQTSLYSLDRPVSTGSSQDRLVTSRDQQTVGEYFGSDVEASVTLSTVKPVCTTQVPNALVTSVIAFTWQDSSGGAPDRANHAWYYVARPKLANGNPDLTKLAQLHRSYCSETLPPALPATVTSDVTVARSIGPLAPILTCDLVPISTTCPATTRLVALRISLGRDSSTKFGIQAQRRMVTS
jgi:prepilin-type N-terminal cleavage/methylation domain-containing protein